MVSKTLVFALTNSRELDSVLIGSARRVPRVACDALCRQPDGRSEERMSAKARLDAPRVRFGHGP